VIRDVYVGYADSMIEAEPTMMAAYFGVVKHFNATGKDSNGSGGNAPSSDDDVTSFLTSLNNAKHSEKKKN